ncbi:hypothetical protein PFISCL1PPCAC_12131, partial [Pristionchus fissidentatus]
RSSGGKQQLEGRLISTQQFHVRVKSPTSEWEYYHSYTMDLMYNKKVYRVPFKGPLISCNQKMDQVAFISVPEEIEIEYGLGGVPSCLAWSPDGIALVIGMNTCVYHIIDAEAGMREMALESIVKLWRIPGLVTELYLNFD